MVGMCRGGWRRGRHDGAPQDIPTKETRVDLQYIHLRQYGTLVMSLKDWCVLMASYCFDHSVGAQLAVLP